MVILKKAKTLITLLNHHIKEGKKIGFVPTMGALHQGHISLIISSSLNNDITVCSIFVNPSQFNNPEDYKHYPQQIDKDISLLEPTNCDILFIPSIEEMYPPGYCKKIYELGDLEKKFEGLYRPGHFQGVCQVVDQLLAIIRPAALYLGQKDYQQFLVIQKLLKLTGRSKSISLAMVPTKREEDGLAMSSRNMRLHPGHRAIAAEIWRQLEYLKNHVKDGPFPQLIAKARLRLEEVGFQVDYVDIVRVGDLQQALDVSTPLVGLIAATIGGIRLIDNRFLN
ncbi:MAG: pantoate--beta-alanine ligase [Flavisolibacter sp.]